MSDAPSPQRAASAEERDRLREALARHFDGTAFLATDQNPSGLYYERRRQMAYREAEETIAGPLAPLLDRITAAAEARAENLQGLLVTQEICADKLKGESADLRRLLAENVVIEVVDDDEQSRELLAGIVAVTNARNAAEANLLALSRMYGEACRDLMGEACGHRLFARMYGDACEALLAATADRDRLADEVARLREALTPFAFGDPLMERILYDGMPDDAPGTFTIKMGDIRAARRALTATGGTTDG